MNIYDRIKQLCEERHISVAELERTLGFSNGSLYKWTKTSPSAEKLKTVADYFNVTVDYLLGRNSDLSKDPFAYFRMDTTGLQDDEIEDMKEQLNRYSAFLKSEYEKNKRKRK